MGNFVSARDIYFAFDRDVRERDRFLFAYSPNASVEFPEEQMKCEQRDLWTNLIIQPTVDVQVLVIEKKNFFF